MDFTNRKITNNPPSPALKLTDLYKSQTSKHMFKCLNLNVNILPKHSDIYNYSTRNNNKFIASKCSTRK